MVRNRLLLVVLVAMTVVWGTMFFVALAMAADGTVASSNPFDKILEVLPLVLGSLVPFLTRLLLPFMSNLPPSIRGLINTILGIVTGAMTGGTEQIASLIEGAGGSLVTHVALHTSPTKDGASPGGR